MKGLSVYLSSPMTEEFTVWIARMRSIGFTCLFTSLHIPEEDPAIYVERLQHLGALAKQQDMELFADIAPKSLSALGKTWEDAHTLKKWGVTGLRVDYGVTPKQVADLSRRMNVALNASTLSRIELDEMKRYGMVMENVEAWHNFYPRKETGLDRQWFDAKNKWLTDQGLSIQAFIPGDGTLRGPLFEKLPTLEEHRTWTPFASYIDLIKNVDRILVGDPGLTEETINQFTSYNEGTIVLRAEANQKIEVIHREVHTNRMDPARDVVRSVESRSYGLAGNRQVKPIPSKARPIGTITVDNLLYGRYAGEMQVTKRDLPADERVNVLGRVIESDLPLIRSIGPGMTFQINWQ